MSENNHYAAPACWVWRRDIMVENNLSVYPISSSGAAL